MDRYGNEYTSHQPPPGYYDTGRRDRERDARPPSNSTGGARVNAYVANKQYEADVDRLRAELDDSRRANKRLRQEYDVKFKEMEAMMTTMRDRHQTLSEDYNRAKHTIRNAQKAMESKDALISAFNTHYMHVLNQLVAYQENDALSLRQLLVSYGIPLDLQPILLLGLCSEVPGLSSESVRLIQAELDRIDNILAGDAEVCL